MADAPLHTPMSRRTLLKAGAGFAGAALAGPTLLAACGSSGGETASTTTAAANSKNASIGRAMGGPELLEAAKANGALQTVSVGEEHSFYDQVLAGFQKYSGIEPNIEKALYPPKGAVDDTRAASEAGEPSPYDVMELPADWAARATTERLVTPYRNTLWDDIPSLLKDPSGNWSAAYLGLVSFIVNTTATEGFVPETWADLLDNAGPASFGMLGRPSVREGEESALTGGLALLTVLSASIANGGSLDEVGPGIDYFAELAGKGIYQPFNADGSETAASLAVPGWVGNGSVPIAALFSFDLPSTRFYAEEVDMEVTSVRLEDGLVASFYAQAITVDAPNPDAAKLWIEYLQSDQGAAEFLQGGAIPARYAALKSNKSTAAEVRELIPDEAVTDKMQIPTTAQLEAAQAVVNERWDSDVLGV